jgi:hypothetical protein
VTPNVHSAPIAPSPIVRRSSSMSFTSGFDAANRPSFWLSRLFARWRINKGYQALLDGDRLKGDRQLPGIDDQAVDFYQPGEGTAGEAARQRPIMVEWMHRQSLSHLLCLVAAGAGGDTEITTQIRHRHIRRGRFVLQEVDLAQRVKPGAGPGLLMTAGQRAWPPRALQPEVSIVIAASWSAAS